LSITAGVLKDRRLQGVLLILLTLLMTLLIALLLTLLLQLQ
jgi:hypothetical protein